MKKRFLIFLLLLIPIIPAAAQTAEAPAIELSLSRNWGYGGFGELQGLMTLSAKSAQPLTRVTFFINGQVMTDDTEPPFAFQFSTDDYPPGDTRLWAEGFNAAGERLTSNEINVRFLSAEEANGKTREIIIPILVLAGGAILLSALIPLLMGRGKPGVALPPGATRNYGLMGGAVCPKCARPFGLHWWAFNISFFGKIDRCPHCGKWSAVRRAPPEVLRAAEQAEIETAQAATPELISQEERLRREIEQSRFQE
ncbi:MAG: hypothetical protein OHK0052_21570 [Anaerolineales bacterium]